MSIKATQPEDSAVKKIKPGSELHFALLGAQIPPEGVVVMTKIDDRDGVRNERPLLRRGSLWFFPDGSMYVYYRPTHWAFIDGGQP